MDHQAGNCNTTGNARVHTTSTAINAKGMVKTLPDIRLMAEGLSAALAELQQVTRATPEN
jgi:hypothetical protein